MISFITTAIFYLTRRVGVMIAVQLSIFPVVFVNTILKSLTKAFGFKLPLMTPSIHLTYVNTIYLNQIKNKFDCNSFETKRDTQYICVVFLGDFYVHGCDRVNLAVPR